MLRLLLALLLLASPAAAAEKPKLVASFSILGDMAQAIGGDAIALTVLVGPGEDAHVYQPTPADAKAVAEADAILVNGLGFEGWLPRLIRASGTQGETVTASDGVAPIAGDPHAWQSLANAGIYAANIRDALIRIDPAHATLYHANAARYLKELAVLERWTKAQIAAVPQAQRRVITSHDAFAYFAREYGVEFIAPLGLSTESEASAADIAALERQIHARHIRALFLENITDPRLLKQLEHDTGATPGATLYSDALSPAGGPAESYFSLFKHNVTALVEGMRANGPN